MLFLWNGKQVKCFSANVCMCLPVSVGVQHSMLTELLWGHRGPQQRYKTNLRCTMSSSTVDLRKSAILQSDLSSVENLSQFCFVFLTLSSVSYSDTHHHQESRSRMKGECGRKAKRQRVTEKGRVADSEWVIMHASAAWAGRTPTPPLPVSLDQPARFTLPSFHLLHEKKAKQSTFLSASLSHLWKELTWHAKHIKGAGVQLCLKCPAKCHLMVCLNAACKCFYFPRLETIAAHYLGLWLLRRTELTSLDYCL